MQNSNNADPSLRKKFLLRAAAVTRIINIFVKNDTLFCSGDRRNCG